MSDTDFLGYGSSFLTGDGASPEAFVAVAGLNSITPGPMSTAVIDVTKLNSADAHREKMPGLKDTGPFTIGGDLFPSDPTHGSTGRGLVALWKSRAIFDFKIALSDTDMTTSDVLMGFVSGFKPGEIKPDGVVPFTCEITTKSQATII